ncbi:MAG: hypothetical protein ABMB14_06215 [Myxococcota bacterium]
MDAKSMLVAAVALTGCLDPEVGTGSGGALDRIAGIVGPPDAYAVRFVATASTGADRNEAGDVVGTSYRNLACGPFCLPVQDPVVWQGGVDRVVLPAVPGFVGVYPTSIDPTGTVAGLAGFPGTNTVAAVWQPTAQGGYLPVALGTLPNTTASYAVGIDDTGRVLGWSTTLSIPPVAAPFLWTETGGMVDLTTLGFPADQPLFFGPGGMVATATTVYDVDDPASVVVLNAPPAGYLLGNYPAVVNDAGEQARFLVTTGGQNLVYPFRYHPDGTWQQLSPVGTGNLSSYGLSGIDDDGTVTGTVLGGGQIAFGVDGVFESIDPMLSPAYTGALVGMGVSGASGDVLGAYQLGTSTRLVVLEPVSTCASNCAVVDRLVMQAKFVEDPQFPGSCFFNGNMHNLARVRLTVTDEAGLPLAGAEVSGRFVDDYWLDEVVVGVTNGNGKVTLSHDGICGDGTIAFLVDDVVSGTRTFDRTTGTLSASKIPN